MHEFAICQRLVEAGLEAVAPHAPARVASLRVRAGALHQLVPDFMESAYGILTQDTPLAGSRLELVTEPVTARCNACGLEQAIEPPLFQCASCGGFDLETLCGRELVLESIVLLEDAKET